MHKNEVLPQGHKSETKEQEGLQGGAPSVAGHTPWAPPMRASQSIMSYLDPLGKAPKGGFPENIPKSTFTIHDDIFQRPFKLKIVVWA